MNKSMKIVTAVSVALAFVISLVLIQYKVQIPYVSIDKIIPLKNVLMVYTFFLWMSFFENREEYQKNNIIFLSAIVPCIVTFLFFRGEELVPEIYQNLGMSSLSVLAILSDIARKKNVQKEIAQTKNRT